MSATTIETLKSECVAEAVRQGHTGHYEMTDADMEWIADQLGRPDRRGFSASELDDLGVAPAFRSAWLADGEPGAD